MNKIDPINVSMIVIGNEILNGRTTDLNACWLSKFLFKNGLFLKGIHFIHDDAEEINQILTASLAESDVVITSGGIGPTADDITKKTLAAFFGKAMNQRQDIAKIVMENYARFNKVWAPSTNYYHFFPDDFIGISNPRGLAPGIAYITPKQKLILAAPGVPREFTEMVECEFYPLIKNIFQARWHENHQTIIRTQNIPEEKIFFELCPTLWTDLEIYGKVSSLPHTIGIDIVVSYHGDLNHHQDINEKIKNLILKTPLAPHVWQWGNIPINELVIAKAREKKYTFGFAESCTGGLTSSKITDLPGVSEVFYGSVVCYDNSIKENLLKVKKESLEKFGSVSTQVAEEMARGARNLLKTDFAISISGIAGPSGGTPQKPLGLVAIGYASKNKNGAEFFQFNGDRMRLKDRFSDKALLTLLELMTE